MDLCGPVNCIYGPQGQMGPKGQWAPKVQWSQRPKSPIGPRVPKAQRSKRPKGPQGPRIPKAQGSQRPKGPKGRRDAKAQGSQRPMGPKVPPWDPMGKSAQGTPGPRCMRILLKSEKRNSNKSNTCKHIFETQNQNAKSQNRPLEMSPGRICYLSKI